MKGEYLEFNQKTIDKIEEITLTDYEFVGTKILAENCIDIIEDLLIFYDNLQEKYNDYKEQVLDRFGGN